MIELQAGSLRVELLRAWPDHHESLALQLPAAACVADALHAARSCGWEISAEEAGRVAIFGRVVDEGARLHAGDRIELLRPLLVDPKQRRRARAAAAKPR